MWKVKSLKIYRSDGKYLAFIKAANGEITKVKINVSFFVLILLRFFEKPTKIWNQCQCQTKKSPLKRWKNPPML